MPTSDATDNHLLCQVAMTGFAVAPRREAVLVSRPRRPLLSGSGLGTGHPRVAFDVYRLAGEWWAEFEKVRHHSVRQQGAPKPRRINAVVGRSYFAQGSSGPACVSSLPLWRGSPPFMWRQSPPCAPAPGRDYRRRALCCEGQLCSRWRVRRWIIFAPVVVPP